MLVRKSFKKLVTTFKNFLYIEFISIKLGGNIGKKSVFKVYLTHAKRLQLLVFLAKKDIALVESCVQIRLCSVLRCMNIKVYFNQILVK